LTDGVVLIRLQNIILMKFHTSHFHLHLLLLLPLTLLVQSCFFTGVESTPRITGKDVRREVAPVTPEDTYLADVADSPLSAWERGKEFMVTDPRISRIFGATAPTQPLTGKIIRYDSASETTGITGSPVTDVTFISPEGDRLVYRINRSLRRLMSETSTEIPFTIQMSVIAGAADRLIGKKFYILTSSWRDDTDNPVGGGRKFIPVTVDSVAAGNSLFPVKVAFTDPEGRSARIFIHAGAKGEAPRTFSRVFSFADPRIQYPHITPEHWQLIIDGRVTEGMTLEECRLSLGTPKEIERGATNSFYREAWLYENGVYLLFEDGLLKRFRH